MASYQLKDIPYFYQQMMINVKEFLKYNTQPQNKLLYLKNYYQEIVKQFYIKPLPERKNIQVGWNNINCKKIDPKMREINYLLAFNAFPNLKNTSKSKFCLLCKCRIETTKHLLYECRFAKSLLNHISTLINDISYEEIIYMNQINIKKTIIYSTYKYTIITTRNMVFKNETIKQINQFMSQIIQQAHQIF